jgi:hypothetical protein
MTEKMISVICGVSATVLVLVLNALLSFPASAWGDEGHEVVALIAQAHLDPAVQKRINALLGADTDSLTAHDIAAEATWADKLRESGGNGVRQMTRQWHYIDIEIAAPDLDRACFDHPSVPPGTPASKGPARDCIVDKIQEFAAELSSPATDPEEQIVALKFLLHSVADVHQPLHASDDHDRGGNDKRVSASGFKAGNLHHYWDTAFVDRLGPNARRIATDLNGHISELEVQAWSQGEAVDWALESFKVAQDDTTVSSPSSTQAAAFGCQRLHCHGNSGRCHPTQQSWRAACLCSEQDSRPAAIGKSLT